MKPETLHGIAAALNAAARLMREISLILMLITSQDHSSGLAVGIRCLERTSVALLPAAAGGHLVD